MCTTRNRKESVFSLRFRILVLRMSSRLRSPKILVSGLWSTATMRSEHPRTKCRVLCKASARASDSPSTALYLDSADCVNLLSTMAIFQPCWQQNSLSFGHWQCFWKSQYPIPSLDQSVARQVWRDLSKICTPMAICWIMNFFERSMAAWRGGVHLNCAFLARKGVGHCKCVAHLIHKTKPGSDVRDVGGSGKVGDRTLGRVSLPWE